MQALTPAFLMAFKVTQLRREGVMPAGCCPAKTALRSSSKFPFRFAARRFADECGPFGRRLGRMETGLWRSPLPLFQLASDLNTGL